MKVTSVVVDNDLKRLCFLYDRVEAHVRALQVLGIQCESCGKLLVPFVMVEHESNNLESYRSTRMELECSVKGLRL